MARSLSNGSNVGVVVRRHEISDVLDPGAIDQGTRYVRSVGTIMLVVKPGSNTGLCPCALLNHAACSRHSIIDHRSWLRQEKVLMVRCAS